MGRDPVGTVPEGRGPPLDMGPVDRAPGGFQAVHKVQAGTVAVGKGPLDTEAGHSQRQREAAGQGRDPRIPGSSSHATWSQGSRGCHRLRPAGGERERS